MIGINIGLVFMFVFQMYWITHLLKFLLFDSVISAGWEQTLTTRGSRTVKTSSSCSGPRNKNGQFGERPSVSLAVPEVIFTSDDSILLAAQIKLRSRLRFLISQCMQLVFSFWRFDTWVLLTLGYQSLETAHILSLICKPTNPEPVWQQTPVQALTFGATLPQRRVPDL